MLTKYCKSCSQEKPVDDFYRQKTRDGYSYYCKVCKNAKNKEYVRSNRDKVRQRIRDWYNRNPGKSAEYAARYYQNNYEKALESRRKSTVKWQSNNREKMLAARRDKYWSDVETSRAKKREYQRKRVGRGEQHVTMEMEAEIVARTGGLCNYCDSPWEHLDHFYPLSRGGGHHVENLVPACKVCNSSKNASDPFEWMEAKGIEPKVIPNLVNRED